MSLTESSTRVEALQEALIRADMKSSLVGDRNDELEGQLKQVSYRDFVACLELSVYLHFLRKRDMLANGAETTRANKFKNIHHIHRGGYRLKHTVI